MILGLSGYARVGKDETAKVLVEEFGFKRIAFADKLRDFLYALNPTVLGWDKNGYGDTVRLIYPLREVIDEYGWDGYKSGPFRDNVRGLLQRLGTEAGREVLWPDIWIDAAFHDIDKFGDVVVTDVRFPNEAGAIQERGGILWRITRDGVGPTLSEDGTAHPSETSLDNYDGFVQYIQNDGTLEEFHEKVRRAGDRWIARV